MESKKGLEEKKGLVMIRGHVTIDIETLNLSDDELELEFNLVKPNANIKDPQKKEKNINDKKRKIREKSALQDHAKLGCIGCKAGQTVYCFTSFGKMDKKEIEALEHAGILVQQHEAEKDMLQAFNGWIDSETNEETEVVTFNGYGFDLPKIRLASARNSVQIPEVLLPGQPGKDLMFYYSKYFSTGKSPFVSLSEVCIRLGICKGKIGSGKLFPRMIEDCEYIEAIIYNALDCILTDKVYRRLL